MSRSVKKIYSYKNETSCKYGQRRANKVIRHFKDSIPNGAYYKRIFNTWDICDYKIIDYFEKDLSEMRK